MDHIVKKKNLTVQKSGEKSKFEQMQKIVKKDCVIFEETPFNVNKSLNKKTITDAEVILRKNGDVLTSIEVICPCGNKIEILCQYD
ncbi:MAG: hypothetical protein AB1454_09655 [Candidatus Auribacterota bacterium]